MNEDQIPLSTREIVVLTDEELASVAGGMGDTPTTQTNSDLSCITHACG